MTAKTGEVRKRPIDRAGMTQIGDATAPDPLRPQRGSLSLRYGMAVGSIAIWLIVALTAPFAGQDNGLLMALAAVTVSAWYGGVGPGLLATLLTLLSVDYVMPLLRSAQSVPMDGLRPSLFASVGILVSALSEAKRHAED